MAQQSRLDLLQGTLDLLILRTLQTGGVARVGHLGTDSADLARYAAGESGVAVPGAASPGTPGLDQGRMGRFGAGAARAILQADGVRAQATGAGNGKLGAAGRGHRARAGDGVT